MKTNTKLFLVSMSLAGVALSGCMALPMAMPLMAGPQNYAQPGAAQPNVAQPGDEALTWAQLAAETRRLNAKIRDLDASRKKASATQDTAQLAGQAGQIAAMAGGGRGSSFLPMAGVVTQTTSAGASVSTANVDESYQLAVARKQYVDGLSANKNCVRK
jgi:hypothetical protein